MASDQSPEQLGPLIVRAVACCESLAAQLKEGRALAASAGPRHPSSHRAPIQTNPDLRPIPDRPVWTVSSAAEERLLKLDQRHSALMKENETLRSLHDSLCAAHDPLGTPPSLRQIEAELSPSVPVDGCCMQSARPSRPIRMALSQPPTRRLSSSSSAAPRTSPSASATAMNGNPACSRLVASSTRRRAGLCTA